MTPIRSCDRELFTGRLADKVVQVKSYSCSESANAKTKHLVWKKEIENVFKFKYLDSIFAANDRQNTISSHALLRLCQDAVNWDKFPTHRCIRMLPVGLRVWNLTTKRTDDEQSERCGANNIMLSRNTDNSIRIEARAATSSYNLVRHIRRRRFKWLGQILRLDTNRLLQQMIQVQYDNRTAGDLLMDAPQHQDFNNLIQQARDKRHWKSLGNGIY